MIPNIGLLENPIGFFIFPVGKLCLLWELHVLISYGTLIIKEKYLTCQVRHTLKTKVVIFYRDNGLSFFFNENCILSWCKNATLALA